MVSRCCRQASLSRSSEVGQSSHVGTSRPAEGREGEYIQMILAPPANIGTASKASGTAETCFVSKLLDDYENTAHYDAELEEDIKALGAITYLGA